VERHHPARARRARGVTLIELLVVVIIAGALAAIALPAYSRYHERARVRQGVADLMQMQLRLQQFETANGEFPETLADAGLDDRLDPWGRPYRYLNVVTAPNRGALRKDRNLVPINSDYDLYSAGPDGESRPPLTARHSRDDLIRAGNGSFFGIAEDY
jgi:general secretion pathway protein G